MPGYHFMRNNNLFMIILIIVLVISSLLIVNSKWLVIKESESGKVIWQQPGQGTVKFAIKYLHSVERTPVWEYFAVKDDKLYLTGTKYESYGAGLPFLKQHTYVIEDDKFEIKNIDKELNLIPLRVSDYALHRFIINKQEYKLYQMTEPQNLVIIKVKEKSLLALLKYKLLN
ncbi:MULTISPECIES: DUF1850 domain-containing protein [unclassified Candidatus Frackibacter]|uniref:DUF1850 domain-containing protein n=1 Tax=unclassified Candidatus Frackibacter TaxID=2648818 RepID=UPI000799AC47|nr:MULTISPECIES: DUF1850 domain-containing protein [unclassified Candidatus Frackibacter]KXS45617.1 MAG: hypothetical protein AWU54_260 [Candidatus Frackibacter sp. T328-2]SDC59753.1 hypothetical protein SAMN04515661_11537 [Candidatus Frackibacter sp. WG11]SEM42084.1 hypothetical protein SAMN04488698_103119 [Candidatus Frackibacter sp. WG12]SFL84833.1 hypothetical protein SAMN04488699_11626 [Candidatus Frackibacter sp. WG13]